MKGYILLIKIKSVLAALIIFNFVSAQSLSSDSISKLIQKYSVQSFINIKDILSIPNNSQFTEDIKRNINYLIEKFNALDFKTELLPTGGNPLLYIEKVNAQKSKTILFYLQLDGQPVDSSKWQQHDPYLPVLKKLVGDKWQSIKWAELSGNYSKEWRVFSRSASDAKGPIAMFLTALQILKSENIDVEYNIKAIFDTEEEIGSPRLAAAVSKYKLKLQSDMLVILDGPRHISNKPTLIFGARGIASLQLTAYGPKVPQHSGHYGNYAPNPALSLSKLLASMKDKNGRVTIPGFYDGVNISDEDYEIMNVVPDNEEEIKRKIGIAEADKVGRTYQESLQYPSLNIDGFTSAWTGSNSRTIVPSTAVAVLDIRLVPESDPEKIINLVKDHIRKENYYLIENDPTDEQRTGHKNIVSFRYVVSYPAFRTELDSPIGIWLSETIENVFGKNPIRIRISGGSVPIAPFVTTLNIPAVIVPTVNPDNNQHSPNENIRIGNYLDGIKTCLSILTTNP